MAAPALTDATGATEHPRLRRAGAGGAASPPSLFPTALVGVEAVGHAPAPLRARRPVAGMLAPVPRVPIEAVPSVLLAARGPGTDVPCKVPLIQTPDDGAGAPTGGAVAPVATPMEAGRPKRAALTTQASSVVAARDVAITTALVPQTALRTPVTDVIAPPPSAVVPMAARRPIEVGLRVPTPGVHATRRVGAAPVLP